MVRYRQARHGFSLIEVAAALVMLSSALIAALTIQQRIVRAAIRHQENLRVVGAAQNLRADYLLSGSTDRAEGELAEPLEDYTYVIERESTEYPGVLDLVVTVRRDLPEDDSGEERTRKWELHRLVRE